VTAVQRAGAAAVDRNAATAYVAGYSPDGTLSQLAFIRTDTNEIVARAATGDLPAAVALSPDGATLYVANTGSNSVSVVSTHGRNVIATIPVGASPMGVAVAAVPQVCNGDCNGDGSVAVNELVQAVGIALDEQAVGSCPAADRDDDGAVTVDEILDATQNALHACSMGR